MKTVSLLIWHDLPRIRAVMTLRAMLAAVVCTSFAVPALAQTATDAELQELKAAVRALMAKNQELSARLSTLEAGQATLGAGQARPQASTGAPRTGGVPAPQTPFRPSERTAAATPPPERVPKPTAPAAESTRVPPASASQTPSGDSLERRVTELEISKTAQEAAVRTIIQDANAKAGSKINEFVTFGGALEMLGGRSSDFNGIIRDSITLNTAELDFEVRANDWMLGTLALSYNQGTSVLFPTTSGFNLPVDRVTVDRASIFVGDVQRFPIYMKTGYDVLPFGISTGVTRLDVLSVENPLTIEVFETRAANVGIGFALPTPEPGPAPPPFVAPPVRPLVINPLVRNLARRMGYKPLPERIKPPVPGVAPVEPPPFYGSLYVYDANVNENVDRRLFSGNFNGTLGYQTQGSCGQPYSELTDSWVCPWAIDVSIDYLGSVFDSSFLQDGYRAFIPQIGKTPGMAASLKSRFGRFLFVAEWNGAITDARFVDDSGRQVRMAPSAWQVSFGYQFDWNPWIETIGGRGDYVAVSYSQTNGLAGVNQLISGVQTRVGFAPRNRLIFTAAEWVMDNARVALEYSHVWDYPTAQGGTGRQADGVFAAITYVW
jgi:hypothetical protein